MNIRNEYDHGLISSNVPLDDLPSRGGIGHNTVLEVRQLSWRCKVEKRRLIKVYPGIRGGNIHFTTNARRNAENLNIVTSDEVYAHPYASASSEVEDSPPELVSINEPNLTMQKPVHEEVALYEFIARSVRKAFEMLTDLANINGLPTHV